MASKRIVGPAAALVVTGSIQTTVVILDAMCGTSGTKQWLIILIFRGGGRIVRTSKVRMVGMKLGAMRVESARRVVQP